MTTVEDTDMLTSPSQPITDLPISATSTLQGTSGGPTTVTATAYSSTLSADITPATGSHLVNSSTSWDATAEWRSAVTDHNYSAIALSVTIPDTWAFAEERQGFEMRDSETNDLLFRFDGTNGHTAVDVTDHAAVSFYAYARQEADRYGGDSGGWTGHNYREISWSLDATEAEPTTISIDIKPNTCPNPLNVRSKGRLSVAILSTIDFNVTDIDTSTLRLNGVEPLKNSLKNVSGPLNDCDCTTTSADNIEDLVLKFDIQEVYETLEPVSNGDEIPLTIIGELLDGTAIEGSDCVVIKGVGKK